MAKVEIVLFWIAIGGLLIAGCQCTTCGDVCQCHGVRAECRNQNLTRVPVLKGSITQLIFVGNYLPNVTNETFENVKHLNLSKLVLANNSIKLISSNALTSFRVLLVLNLSGNKNVTMPSLKSAMRQIRNTLENITLDSLGLTELADDLFEELIGGKVKMISLKRNRIKVFNESAFQNLTHLQSLHLEYNWIKNKTRIGIQPLQHLHLGHNEFSPFIPWFCRQYKVDVEPPLYPELRKLYLEHNLINVLVPAAISCLSNLTELVLTENVISVLRDDIFANLTSLDTLRLDRMPHAIREIHIRAFNNTKLKRLFLNDNSIHFNASVGREGINNFTAIFQYVPNLLYLDLSRNSFRGVPDQAIAQMLLGLKNLTHLVLPGMRLKTIPVDLFLHFKQLKYLDLASNFISEWDPIVFKNVSSLQTLILRWNAIQVVEQSSFPADLLHSLRNINLANNPFACECSNMWFRDWIDSSSNSNDTSQIQFLEYPDNYTCRSPYALRGTLLREYRPTAASCKNKSLLRTLTIVLGSCLVLLVVGIATAYKLRWYITYMMVRARRRWARRTRSRQDQLIPAEQFVRDGYVIYADADVDFVINDFRNVVERGGEFRLFIRARDGEVCGAKVDDMVDNMYSSRAVFVIVSRNLMRDPWCQFQVDVAIDRKIELGVEYIFLVKLQDVVSSSLTNSWCVLLAKTPTGIWSGERLKQQVFEQQVFAALESQRADA